MQSLLASRALRPAGRAADPGEVARIVGIARRHGPHAPQCLAAALTLQSLLRRSGVDAHLRLGVRKLEGRLEAHAWVEHDGRVLMDSRDVHGRYTAFDGPIR